MTAPLGHIPDEGELAAGDVLGIAAAYAVAVIAILATVVAWWTWRS